MVYTVTLLTIRGLKREDDFIRHFSGRRLVISVRIRPITPHPA